MSILCKETLNKISSATACAFLGIGSELCGDDIVGVLVIRELQALLPNSAALFVEGGNAPENCTGMLRNYKPDLVILIDAADVGDVSGDIRELTPQMCADTGFFTHRPPMGLLLSYLEQELHADVLIIGIRPDSLAFMGSVSESVNKAAEMLAKELAANIKI